MAPAVEIAYHSPLPPARSGIADYSALLLPALRSRMTVRTVGPGDRTPAGAVPLYHLGNDPIGHGWIVDRLAVRRGVVVLHEVSLHELFAARALGRRDPEAYLGHVEREHGRRARAVAREALEGLRPPLWESHPLEFPLIRGVLDRADAVVVHSRFAAEHVRATGYGGPLHVIRHPARRPSSLAMSRRSGTIICSAGIVNWTKRVPQLLRAFALLKKTQPAARLVLAGPGARRLNLVARLDALGLQAGADVLVPGYLDEDRLTTLLVEATACVNLRSPTLGETSGSVVRALALGRPIVVSEAGWFAELPASVAVKVPAGGALEIELLAAVLERLCADASARQRLGAAAREYAEREHDLERAADAYARVLEQAA